MTEKFAVTIDLASGERAACDLRHADFPLGWSAVADTQAGAVRGCNVARPAASDWLVPAENGDIPAGAEGAKDTEPVPVAWLRFEAGIGGTLRGGVVAGGQVFVHRSTDALAASGALAAISGLAVGDRVRRALDALFAYGGPAGADVLAYSVHADVAGVVAPSIEDGGFLRLDASGTGTANVTVTATAPGGQTASLPAFAVTVA